MSLARWISLVMCFGSLASVNAGDLRVTCSPGLDIVVDGERVGACGSAENGKYLTGLDNGLHVVRIEKDGFVPREFPVVVGPTSRQVVVGGLSPRSAAGEGGEGSRDEVEKGVGTIELTSEPAECTVRIGDRWAVKKEAIMTILDVPTGEHDLWVARFGELLKTEVVVTPDTPVRVNADFVQKRIEAIAGASENADGGESQSRWTSAGEPGCVEYWVQVLWTSDLEVVEATQKALDGLGFPPRDQKLITIEDDGVLPLYKLRIGPLRDRKTAKLVIHETRPLKIIGPLILTEPCQQPP